MTKSSPGESALIANDDLVLANIPASDADWGEIMPFAHTFDGYKIMGSFEACAAIANERRQETLTELRTCLFFEARRWRHFGEDPDPLAMEYIRGLLTQIRDRIATERRR
jgi:hypothetical protein